MKIRPFARRLCLLTLFFVGTRPWGGFAADMSLTPSLSHSDDALRTAIEKSFRVQYALRDIKDTTLVQVMIQMDHPPTGMGFEMSVRTSQSNLPLGPVAWAKGEIGWWAYDTDLPEDIESLDIVLTPSEDAAGDLKRDDPFRLGRLGDIWSGAPIILTNRSIQSQEITMCSVKPPKLAAARAYAMEEFDQADPAIQRLKAEGNWEDAHVQLERAVGEHSENVVSLYDLGCVLMAEGDLADALKQFVRLKALAPAPEWQQRAQRQLRHICAFELYLAKQGDAKAMNALGSAYEHGWGVKQIYQDAKHWYRNAANAGNVEAMCRVAAMYEHETGAVVHTAEAHQWYRNETLVWYRKAAELGNEEANQWMSAHTFF